LGPEPGSLTVSVVGFLIQISRHKPSRRWAVTAVASLVLLLIFGVLSNAVSRQSGQTLTGEQSTLSNAISPEDYDVGSTRRAITLTTTQTAATNTVLGPGLL
jgi:hypothetical protein